MKRIKLVCCAGRYEWSATCESLDEVVSTIDDWSTLFCEDGDLTVMFHGIAQRMPVSIFTEVEE